MGEKTNLIYPADKTFRIIRIFDFNRAQQTCYLNHFHCAISGEQNGACWCIVLRIMLLTYIRAMIRFSNSGRHSRMNDDHELQLTSWLVLDVCLCWTYRGSTSGFSLLFCFSQSVIRHQKSYEASWRNKQFKCKCFDNIRI